MKDRIRRAKELRERGFLYREIAAELGVSTTMARNYVLDLNTRRPSEHESASHVCNDAKHHHIKCERRKSHGGVHLANDKKNRLIYWE